MWAACISISPKTVRTPRPFAFLATYASGLVAHREVRHAPLGAALREYAGAGANAELLRLLEPVSRASESCAWLKAIVDSGEIFHPLRWTPVTLHLMGV